MKKNQWIYDKFLLSNNVKIRKKTSNTLNTDATIDLSSIQLSIQLILSTLEKLNK